MPAISTVDEQMFRPQPNQSSLFPNLRIACRCNFGRSMLPYQNLCNWVIANILDTSLYVNMFIIIILL